MKSDEEIIKIVEKTKNMVQQIYADDKRLLNSNNQQPNSGVAEETKIVFQEILNYLLNN